MAQRFIIDPAKASQEHLRQWTEELGKGVKAGEIRISDWSIRDQFEACFGTPALRRFMEYDHGMGYIGNWSEAPLNTTAFSVITGTLISASMIPAYELAVAPLAQLVTDVQMTRSQENMAGFTGAEFPKEVIEGGEYEYSSIGEKYVQVKTAKYGRLISVTEEMIKEDQTGRILMSAQRIGEAAAAHKGKLVLEGIIDSSGTVYAPSGTAEALYSASARTGQSVANATAAAGTINATNLNTAHSNLLRMKDDSLDNIYISMMSERPVLVCAPSVAVSAYTLRDSVGAPGTANNDVNRWQNMFDIIENPYISTTTDWYYGLFRRQFVWGNYWPLQVFQSEDEQFTRDVPLVYKVRYKGGIAAVDYRYVQKCYT